MKLFEKLFRAFGLGISDSRTGKEGSSTGERLSDTRLELSGVTRSWPGRPPVFSDISLAVPSEGILVLLGPSGCGKSTLLRCAASLDRVDSGRILVDGKKADSPSPDRQLILQDDSQLLPWLTVRENIEFPLRMGSGTSVHQPEELLNLVGLPDAASLYPAQLSGGMRQRVVLARALAVNPAILLLDEPFAALDNAIRSRLQILLKDIHNKAGTAMLLVTHDVAEALVLADAIVFMDSRGRLSGPEANPLGNERYPDSREFFVEMGKMKKRYESLLDPVYS